MKAKDLKILRKKLAKASKVDNNPLVGLSKDMVEIKSSSKNDQTFQVEYMPSEKLAKSAFFDKCSALFEKNMGELYKNSSWGLDMKEKKEELSHSNARYLLIHPSHDASELAGFVHFRYTYDDEEAPTEGVVYVYEIQIDEKYQRLGLGKKIMTIIETLTINAELGRIMLTVFKKNESAMNFYRGINYDVDETSPSMHNEPADYEILSKKMGLKQ